MRKLLCKLGLHWLKEHTRLFIDHVTRKEVFEAKCVVCGRIWMTDSPFPLGGFRVEIEQKIRSCPVENDNHVDWKQIQNDLHDICQLVDGWTGGNCSCGAPVPWSNFDEETKRKAHRLLALVDVMIKDQKSTSIDEETRNQTKQH